MPNPAGPSVQAVWFKVPKAVQVMDYGSKTALLFGYLDPQFKPLALGCIGRARLP